MTKPIRRDDGKLRILWYSNSPAASTGYGVQTSLAVTRLKRMGHDLAVAANYGLEGATLLWEGIPILPRGDDPWSNDIIGRHAEAHEADVILALCDVFVLDPSALRGRKVAAWVPVDHDPPPPRVIEWFDETGAIPIAMSRFGQKALEEKGFRPLYVPHAFDAKVFHPMDRTEARKALGFPEDAYIVGMVAANKGVSPIRKSFPEAFAAFGRYREKNPKAMLYLHARAHTPHGIDLERLLDQCRVPKESVVAADPYRYHLGFAPEQMRTIYGAMDVLLNPAMGEGFGVAAIEAQACGVPVIATDYTAMPELVKTGTLVGGTRTYTQFQSWQCLPSVDALVDALGEWDGKPTDRAEIAEKVKDYEADAVAERYWTPALEEIRRRIRQ